MFGCITWLIAALAIRLSVRQTEVNGPTDGRQTGLTTAGFYDWSVRTMSLLHHHHITIASRLLMYTFTLRLQHTIGDSSVQLIVVPCPVASLGLVSSAAVIDAVNLVFQLPPLRLPDNRFSSIL